MSDVVRLRERAAALAAALSRHEREVASVIADDLLEGGLVRLDFSARNVELQQLEVGDTQALNELVQKQIADLGGKIGIGGYGENRVWYRRSKLFQSEKGPRTVHLGIDIWAPAGTAVYSPLPGVIHSLRNNANFGDYGPTIIVGYELDGVEFYCLFGHLSEESLIAKHSGQRIEGGLPLGQIGNFPINGDWPPHLHMQLILDMMGKEGDFAGVSSEEEQDFYLALCPNPMLLFSSRALGRSEITCS